MTEPSELDVQHRASTLFENENPGRFWRLDPNFSKGHTKRAALAGMSERQVYLLRARQELRLQALDI